MPRRERLRWEKELLGLYLSEHPLGEIADVLPEYVTAYTGDLAEESDQAKVTLGGIIQGSRRIITRAGSTMLVATVEDLTGSTEVVVFPKSSPIRAWPGPTTRWCWSPVASTTATKDRRSCAKRCIPWDDAVRMGPLAFSAERDRLLRGSTRRWGNGQNGHGRQAVAVEPATPVAVAVEDARELATVGAPEPAEEPEAPPDAVPLQSAPEASVATVAVSIGEEVPADRLLGAIESVKGALAGRPGPLPVVLSLSVAGANRIVRLPDRVAWDDRLGEYLGLAAGVPVAVELRSAVEERIA